MTMAFGMDHNAGDAQVHLNQLVKCSWQSFLKVSGCATNVMLGILQIPKVVGFTCLLRKMMKIKLDFLTNESDPNYASNFLP